MSSRQSARLVTADELCARIDGERRLAPAGVVASDGDGTLWLGDVGDALFDSVADEGGFRECAREALCAEARAAGIDASGGANAVAVALRAAYRGGTYDEGRYFAMQTWAFAGWAEVELGAKCAAVLDAFGFDAAVRPAMRRLLDWCRACGVPFFLVSASPEAIVLEAARRLGIDAENVVAMRPAAEAGALTASLAATPTYGTGKVERLRERLGELTLLAAFGDNTWDAAMLSLAAVPVMVAPKPALRERMAAHAAVVELGDA